MRPIPVVFHIGPLQIHTYGIGLAITFWFAYRYFARRLRAHGYPDVWLGKAFVWIIVSSVVGARAVHVISMWSFYSHNLGDIFAIWHGGLSSYGGLLGGVPVGLWCAHRWCKELGLLVASDLVAPVLTLAWSVGRLLGPQLMYQGGGVRTSSWIGMYYAGQVGKRIPVPLIQAAECFVIWVIALRVEKFVRSRRGPLGLVLTSVVTLWGLSRFFDETVWLPHSTAGDMAVVVGSLIFVGVGVLWAAWLVLRYSPRPVPALEAGVMAGGSEETSPGGRHEIDSSDPWAAPPSPDGEAEVDEVAEEVEVAGLGVEAGEALPPRLPS